MVSDRENAQRSAHVLFTVFPVVLKGPSLTPFLMILKNTEGASVFFPAGFLSSLALRDNNAHKLIFKLCVKAPVGMLLRHTTYS